jgi:hypothetical protein
MKEANTKSSSEVLPVTPLEIFEYKRKWMSGSSNYVLVHSDLEFEAKQWCKANLKQHQWHIVKYTDHYEDTFLFQTKEFKDAFEKGYYDPRASKE